jgi:hypothetical protein
VTLPLIIPISALTGPNNPAYQVSKDNYNTGLFKLTQAGAALLGRSGAGDTQEITVGSGLSLAGTTLTASGGGFTPTDYIAGLVVTKHAAANTIDISAGAYYDPANTTVQTFAAQSGVSAGTLGNSQWNQVYITGTSTIVVSNNADPPSTAYMGTARKDGSDRRWIGAFKTDGSGNIYDAPAVGMGSLVEVVYNATISAIPFRIVPGGTNAAFGAISSFAAVCPKNATVAAFLPLTIDIAAGSGAANMYLSTDGTNINAAQFNTYVAAAGASFPAITAWTPVERTTPGIYYRASNIAYIDVAGYRFAR